MAPSMETYSGRDATRTGIPNSFCKNKSSPASFAPPPHSMTPSALTEETISCGMLESRLSIILTYCVTHSTTVSYNSFEVTLSVSASPFCVLRLVTDTAVVSLGYRLAQFVLRYSA